METYGIASELAPFVSKDRLKLSSLVDFYHLLRKVGAVIVVHFGGLAHVIL